jgi:long-chain acyl-CoA synthetase
MLNLASILTDSARRYPNNIAIVSGKQTCTYQELEERAGMFANSLHESGIGKGSHVYLFAPNTIEFAVYYFGVLKTGAVIVPCNPTLKVLDLEDHFNVVPPDLIIAAAPVYAELKKTRCERIWLFDAAKAATEDKRVTLIDHIIDKDKKYFRNVTKAANETAVMIFTGGIDGDTKAAELSHANMVLNAFASGHRHIAGYTEKHTTLAVLPLFHAFGQTVHLNAGILAGSRIIMMPRFEPKLTWRLLDEEKVNVFCVVPTMLGVLLATEIDPEQMIRIKKNLKPIISGGSKLDEKLKSTFEKTTGLEVREGYGLTEASPVSSYSFNNLPDKPGSIGQPLWNIDAKILDDQGNELDHHEIGELTIRGHNVMKGYYNDPDATDKVLKDGWLRTGDLAYIDDDGYIFLTGRKKDLFIRSGFNVYPKNLTNLLLQNNNILEVEVNSLPDPVKGEEVLARIRAKNGIVESEIEQWIRGNVAAYKRPKSIKFIH